MKHCSQCDAPISNRNNSGLCGYHYRRQWTIENPDKVKAAKTRNLLKHPDKRRESLHKYNNKDSVRERGRNWYLNKKKTLGKTCGDCGKLIYWKVKYCHSCGQKGEKGPGWKGGLTPVLRMLRNREENKVWARKVKERDNYTCQFCGKRGGYLHADHIKPFSRYPELRTDLSNGRTLCKICHYQTDTYGGKTTYA